MWLYDFWIKIMIFFVTIRKFQIKVMAFSSFSRPFSVCQNHDLLLISDSIVIFSHLFNQEVWLFEFCDFFMMNLIEIVSFEPNTDSKSRGHKSKSWLDLLLCLNNNFWFWLFSNQNDDLLIYHNFRFQIKTFSSKA